MDAPILTVQDVLNLPRPPADRRVAYGDDPRQFGDLRLPPGEGAHPVAIVLHGRCWRATHGLDHLCSFNMALADLGVATWSLEYRRLGDPPGGGWPGLF